MFGRISRGARSKPTVVLLPPPSGSASVPGMLTPPQITRAASVYTFIDGTYAGATGRTRTYLLDGVSVAGRVSSGKFTATSGDVGKLLVFRETVTGTGGSIMRQASVVV